MDKRINGHRYNTTTAKPLACWESPDPRNDFSWYKETIYLKRNREYFLHGQGNAASKYAAPYPGGGYQSGEDIIPLGLNEAREWAEQHLDGAEVEELFGPADETNETDTITLDSVSLDQLDYIIHAYGGTRGARIEHLIHMAYNDLKEDERQDAEYKRLGY